MLWRAGIRSCVSMPSQALSSQGAALAPPPCTHSHASRLVGACVSEVGVERTAAAAAGGGQGFGAGGGFDQAAPGLVVPMQLTTT